MPQEGLEDFREDPFARTVLNALMMSLTSTEIQKFFPSLYHFFIHFRNSPCNSRKVRSDEAGFVTYWHNWNFLLYNFRASLLFDVRHEREVKLFNRGLDLRIFLPKNCLVNGSCELTIHLWYDTQRASWRIRDLEGDTLRNFDSLVWIFYRLVD